MKRTEMRALLTGGSGSLGAELRAELPKLGVEVISPTRAELDITRPQTIVGALARYNPDVVVHAAAYTDVARAEEERKTCWETNVEGTRNIVRALEGSKAKLIHISTDYVFWGDRGGYTEDDTPGPVRNYYALSKLVAEEIARVRPYVLVIRTSFRPREWPYLVAFEDIFTSQDYVDVISPEIALAVRHAYAIPYDVLHIATERKSVHELARRRSPGVRPDKRKDSKVALPKDVSLNTQRWQALREHLLSGVSA